MVDKAARLQLARNFSTQERDREKMRQHHRVLGMPYRPRKKTMKTLVSGRKRNTSQSVRKAKIESTLQGNSESKTAGDLSSRASAFKAGFMRKLAEQGMLPSEFDRLMTESVKQATGAAFNPSMPDTTEVSTNEPTASGLAQIQDFKTSDVPVRKPSTQTLHPTLGSAPARTPGMTVNASRRVFLAHESPLHDERLADMARGHLTRTRKLASMLKDSGLDMSGVAKPTSLQKRAYSAIGQAVGSAAGGVAQAGSGLAQKGYDASRDALKLSLMSLAIPLILGMGTGASHAYLTRPSLDDIDALKASERIALYKRLARQSRKRGRELRVA